MTEADLVKILLAHQNQSYVVDCRCRRRVVPPIEGRQLGTRAARSINAQHLFASAGAAFEDANVAGLNQVKSQTPFTLAKYDLSRRVMAGHGALGNPTQSP